MKNRMSKKLIQFLPVITAFGLAGCEFTTTAKKDLVLAFTAPTPQPWITSEPFPSESPTPSPSPSTSTSPTPIPSATPTEACFTDRFEQPEQQTVRSVDILFVADTSGSMSNKRVKVANALYAFVGALPVGTDYRIGVLLAHGSNNPNTGKLYSHNPSTPKVLDSALLSQSSIQQELKSIMLAAPDHNYEQGEMGSYALLQALKPANLQANRSLGFFRENAALAIVTISDENDICAAYPSPLPTNYNLNSFPYASKPGMTYSEEFIRNRDCPNGITSTQIIQAVSAIQGDRPFVMGSVIHTDMNYSDAAGNDSYGWGYGQTVKDNHGVLIDIGSADYSLGLSALGALTAVKIKLLSDFKLNHDNINDQSIKAFVDRIPVGFDFDSALNQVHLSTLGSAKSEIEIQYCKKPAPGTTPSPTPSVDPSPSPTSTSNPTPSPTSQPSSTPSPSPSTSPSPSPSPSSTPTPEPTEPPCEGLECGVFGV